MWPGLAVRAPVNTATNSHQISWFFTFLWDAPNENPVHFWMFAHFFFFFFYASSSASLSFFPAGLSLQDLMTWQWNHTTSALWKGGLYRAQLSA